MKTLYTGTIALIVCLLLEAAQAAGPKKPNILFIFSDDHALRAVGAYGSTINKTPSIDRLAAGGMLFRKCLVGNSICGPSRATILTGKYSHKNGFLRNGNVFDGSQSTLPKYLKEAGYRTAIIGKWHLESDPTGFDYWNILIGQGFYYNPRMIENGVQKRHEGYTTELITDMTLKWIEEQRDSAEPFFLMYQHKAPHRDWQPGPEYLDLYEGITFPEPETLFGGSIASPLFSLALVCRIGASRGTTIITNTPVRTT